MEAVSGKERSGARLCGKLSPHRSGRAPTSLATRGNPSTED